MSRIDGLDTLLLQIRGKLAQRTGPSDKASRTSRTSADATSRRSPARSSDSIKVQLKGAIAGLDLDSETGIEMARIRFVETVLTSELGTEITRDSRFPALSENIREAISADGRLAENLDRLLRDIGKR